jgi:hypothetical protein
MASTAMEHLVDLIVRLGVRIDQSLTPYVAFVMNRKFDAISSGRPSVNCDLVSQQLRQLVEKGLIDADTEVDPASGQTDTINNEEAVFWEYHDRLVSWYKSTGKTDKLDSLKVFVEHLPELRSLFLDSRQVCKKKKGNKDGLVQDDDLPSIADLIMSARGPAISPILKLF